MFLCLGVIVAAFVACGSSSSGASGDAGAAGGDSSAASGGPVADADTDVATDSESPLESGAAQADATSGASSDGASSAGDASPPCPGAKPDATNTGVPAGMALTTVSTDVTSPRTVPSSTRKTSTASSPSRRAT